MSVQTLLVKAEALDLVEIDTCRLRRHVERGVPDDRLVRQVLCRKRHELLLAEMDLHFALHRLETPRQTGRDVTVEPHSNDTTGDCAVIRVCPLRSSSESRCCAEQPIQRRRVCDEAKHNPDHANGGQHDPHVSASRRMRPWFFSFLTGALVIFSSGPRCRCFSFPSPRLSCSPPFP